VSERPKERASKAREGQPSAGSNPAATANLTRPNASSVASWPPAFLAVFSNVVSIRLDALHLAFALTLADELEGIVTCDEWPSGE
jgi:hypothetical protein